MSITPTSLGQRLWYMPPGGYGFFQYNLINSQPSQTTTLSVNVVLGTATNFVIEIGGEDSALDGMGAILATANATVDGLVTLTFVSPRYVDWPYLCINLGYSGILSGTPIQSAGTVETYGWQLYTQVLFFQLSQAPLVLEGQQGRVDPRVHLRSLRDQQGKLDRLAHLQQLQDPQARRDQQEMHRQSLAPPELRVQLPQSQDRQVARDSQDQHLQNCRRSTQPWCR